MRLFWQVKVYDESAFEISAAAIVVGGVFLLVDGVLRNVVGSLNRDVEEKLKAVVGYL